MVSCFSIAIIHYFCTFIVAWHIYIYKYKRIRIYESSVRFFVRRQRAIRQHQIIVIIKIIIIKMHSFKIDVSQSSALVLKSCERGKYTRQKNTPRTANHVHTLWCCFFSSSSLSSSVPLSDAILFYTLAAAAASLALHSVWQYIVKFWIIQEQQCSPQTSQLPWMLRVFGLTDSHRHTHAFAHVPKTINALNNTIGRLCQ